MAYSNSPGPVEQRFEDTGALAVLARLEGHDGGNVGVAKRRGQSTAT